MSTVTSVQHIRYGKLNSSLHIHVIRAVFTRQCINGENFVSGEINPVQRQHLALYCLALCSWPATYVTLSSNLLSLSQLSAVFPLVGLIYAKTACYRHLNHARMLSVNTGSCLSSVIMLQQVGNINDNAVYLLKGNRRIESDDYNTLSYRKTAHSLSKVV